MGSSGMLECVVWCDVMWCDELRSRLLVYVFEG